MVVNLRLPLYGAKHLYESEKLEGGETRLMFIFLIRTLKVCKSNFVLSQCDHFCNFIDPFKMGSIVRKNIFDF